MAERLQKILSQWGIASRRHAEKMILAGRVRVNGAIAQLGQTVNPPSDIITVDGNVLQGASRPQPLYLLLNKPLGVISTCHDPQGRRTVLDLLPPELTVGTGLHPVGRLDANSTGAILLTNDGELTLRLTHPRYHLPKTYRVWVEGHPPDKILQQWRQGVILDGKKTQPAQVEIRQRSADQTLLKITIQEGKKRQIRRIAEMLGCPVVHLHRIKIGSISLQQPNHSELSSGHYRPLANDEVRYLYQSTANLAAPADIKEQRVLYEGKSTQSSSNSSGKA